MKTGLTFRKHGKLKHRGNTNDNDNNDDDDDDMDIEELLEMEDRPIEGTRKRRTNIQRLKKDGKKLALGLGDAYNLTESNDTEEIYTKIYIRAPASLILSHKEHIAQRTHCT
jgi:hypothetical protein